MSLIDAGLLIFLTVCSVILIVTDHRSDYEKKLGEKWGIDRDWWVPAIAFTIAVIIGVVDWDSIRTAFSNDFEIIVLIFSFGVMAEGLSASGFFRYVAYKVVETAKGNTTRLITHLFVMTSVVTLFTTNDIVILIMTPIIVEICFQAGFETGD